MQIKSWKQGTNTSQLNGVLQKNMHSCTFTISKSGSQPTKYSFLPCVERKTGGKKSIMCIFKILSLKLNTTHLSLIFFSVNIKVVGPETWLPILSVLTCSQSGIQHEEDSDELLCPHLSPKLPASEINFFCLVQDDTMVASHLFIKYLNKKTKWFTYQITSF